LVGADYISSETGGLILIGVVLLSAFIPYIAYKILFEKYSEDVPEPFF